MRSEALVALVGANPGPAAHLALLGALLVIGLVIFAFTRWRRRREGQLEHDSPRDDRSLANEPRTEEADRAREHDPTRR